MNMSIVFLFFKNMLKITDNSAKDVFYGCLLLKLIIWVDIFLFKVCIENKQGRCASFILSEIQQCSNLNGISKCKC
jgi:hypothetical protein